MAVWKWAMHIRFIVADFEAVFDGFFEHQRRVQFARVCCKPAANDHSHLAWFQMLGPASKDCFFLLDSPDG